MTNRYESPLSSRYASEYMLGLFSSDTRSEKEFGLTEDEMNELLKPELYIGRCPEQVTALVNKIKQLIQDADGKSAEINL